ncbi:MAG TPA: DegV family protein [Ktedonobacteraceae bacterium]|nr:DegV family protein [Chthonomonadales bacterium]HEV2583343.1 DegV family protein [Ktedonobacteraceae bacterium]
MGVRIVTDSTADIPREQAEALGIAVVPLTVFFGDEAYLDGIELDNAGFYRKLAASRDLPRTSQPSPASFQETYTRLIDEGADAILSVHLSAKLSGTYQSARTARDSLPEDIRRIPIEVVDSQSISVGMSRAILQAAQDARDGQSLEEIKSLLLDQLARTRILAVLDTLEYVKRGGRIGGARAMLGNMLSVKPIISLKDGEVVPVEQPRTRSKAYTRVAEILKASGKIEYVAIAEASEEVGQQLAQVIKTSYTGELPIYRLGAVLGTHTGPGTAAIAYVIAS